MTRKDYELIAAAIHASKPADSQIAYGEQWRNTAETIAARLREQNPRFQTDVFLKVCGVYD